MPITIQDIQDYYGAPVWEQNHAFYVWRSGCNGAGHTTDFTCAYCQVGYWAKVENKTLELIQKQVEENNAKSS